MNRKRKALSDVSDVTYRRRRRNFVNQHFSNEEIENNLDNPISINVDNQQLTDFDTDSIQNNDIDFIDGAESITDDIGLTDNGISANDFRIHLNDNLNTELNDKNLKILDDLFEIYVRYNTSSSLLTKIIDLINLVLENCSEIKFFPKSFYKFKKHFSTIKFNTVFYLITNCCEKQFKDIKLTSINCCNEFENSQSDRKNYFFRFSLEEQLIVLLGEFDLDNCYPGKIFNEFLSLKQNVCALTIFLDDAPSDFENITFTNFFIKINNLKCNTLARTFLHSSSIHREKLKDEEDINFFLKDFIEEINMLYEKGIFIKRLNLLIYPFISLNLFDLVARHQFLFHNSYNGYYGCLCCLAKGERCNSTHIYPPSSNITLRTIELHNNIFRLIENNFTKHPHYLGVKARSPICNIEHQNYLLSTGLEPMHLLSGIIKRIFFSFLNCNTSLCFLNSRYLNILERRIKIFNKFTYNDIFKRKITNFSILSKKNWKSNQYFQFFFFMYPIILENLIDKEVYLHNILLIYIFYNLWSKNEDQLDLNLIRNLIKLYLNLVEKFYPKTNYIPNTHQLEHIVEHYENHGKLSLNNAFIFEHLNGVVKKLPQASFNILEQVKNRSELLFENNIKKEKNKSCTSKIFKTNCKNNNIRSAFNDHFCINTHNSTTKSKDNFVMTHDHRFYKILELYQFNGSIFFKGNQFKVIDNFSENLEFSNIDLTVYYIDIDKLELEYIYCVYLDDEIVSLSTNNIKEKVLYCPNFNFCNSTFLNVKKGLIIRNLIEFHN